MITVELDLFSGRENDSWDLNLVEALDFIATLTADLSVIRPLLSVPASFGPRGYVIRLAGVDLELLSLLGVPEVFRITDLPLDLSYLDIPLGPIAPGDNEDVTDSGYEDPGDPEGGFQAAAVTTAAACSLAYTSWNDFSFWNGTRKAKNNCYCYAANYATNNWSNPGKKGGSPIPAGGPYANRPSATTFTNAMKADGWKTTCSGSSLRIMAYLGKVTAPNGAQYWDYHFYRKNLNGSTVRWCHKPGSTSATNKDASGNYITDPTTADRSSVSGGYTINYNQKIGTFFSPATRYVVIA